MKTLNEGYAASLQLDPSMPDFTVKPCHRQEYRNWWNTKNALIIRQLLQVEDGIIMGISAFESNDTIRYYVRNEDSLPGVIYRIFVWYLTEAYYK